MNRVALALVVAACGGGGGPDPLSSDASTPMADAAPDAPDEATRVDVTVESLNFGIIDPTIVVFYDETGAIVSHGEVDADGRAHGYLPHGGSVTALRSALDGQRVISISTVHHVEPGDQLTFDARIQDPTPTGAEDVMTATYTPPTGGDFSIDRACGLTGTTTGQAGAPLLLHFFESCTTPTFDMLLMSIAAPRQFLWMPDIPYVGGGNFNVPNSWQLFGTLDVTFANLPGTPTDLRVITSLLVGPKRAQQFDEGVQLSSAAPTVSHPWPVGAGRGTAVLAYLGPVLHLDTRMVVGDPAASTIAMDVTALPLPTFPDDELPTQTVGGATWNQSGTPAGDLREVVWHARAAGPNGVRNAFFVTVFDDPTTPATMSLLPLPDDYADRDPTKVLPVALELVGSAVHYVDYDILDGYPDARLHALRYSVVESSYFEGQLVAHATHSRSFFRP
jgi:hypothetical protein